MADTASTLLTKCQREYPQMDQTIFLDLLNDVDADLQEEFPLRVTSEDISLTSGTQEYAYNADTLTIWSVIYHESATSSRKLEPVSIDQLDSEYGNWRSRASGKPNRFYLSVTSAGGPTVGLYPKPDTTTSSGYPKVTMHQSRRSSLDISSTLVTAIHSSRVYIKGICAYFAEQQDRDNKESRMADYIDEKGNLAVRLGRRNRRNPPQRVPAVRRRGRAV